MKYPPVVPKLPHMIHGADYNPDQWLTWKDEIFPEDMRLAKLAGMNSLSVGIFAWAALEPKENRFTFDWLDEIMDRLAANDMVAILATPSGSRPAWLSEKYPEVLRVDERRVYQLHGRRHNHCMTSPIYREKVHTINEKLAERYKAHPALGMWHISNEYSGECHCDLCQERFRDHLKQKYGTLDALNEAWWNAFWGHTYSDWSQVAGPSPLGETFMHGMTLDWKRFTTEQHVSFYQNEIEPLRRLTPDVPCTTNFMGTYTGVDYFRLAQELDVVSWDAYPTWQGDQGDIAIGQRFSFLHDLARSFKRRPFMLMESSPSATNWRPVAKLHRPKVHMLQSMLAVAHGSDTVQYFQFRKGRGGSEKFHGAVVDHAGGENTRVFNDVAQVGARLSAMDAIVGTDTPAKVALLYDWNVRWAIDDARGMNNTDNHYERTVIDHHRYFWKQGIPVDVIDETRSLDPYQLLIAPMAYLLRGDFAQRVDAFVKAGGRFVATYMTGYADENDLCFRGGFPGPLMDTLGIWNEEIDALYPDDENKIVWNGGIYKVVDFCERIHLRGAQMWGVYADDFYKGMPAVTVNERGAGKAYYIAARTGDDFLADFYTTLTDELSLPRAVEGPLPEGVTAQWRTDGETDYIFLLNFSPNTAVVPVKAGYSHTLSPYDSAILRVANGQCNILPGTDAWAD